MIHCADEDDEMNEKDGARERRGEKTSTLSL
jgi:hypothetical protein